MCVPMLFAVIPACLVHHAPPGGLCQEALPAILCTAYACP